MLSPAAYGFQYLWSSWSTALISSALGVFLIYHVFKFLLTDRSSKQIDFLVELTAEVCGFTSSAAGSHSAPASESQSSDADDFDFEDDDDNWETEGVERHTTSGRGRRGESYSGLHLNKKSSLVRITSSDPRSSLSTSPIQLDLDSGHAHRRAGHVGGIKGNHAIVRRVNGNANAASSPHRKRKESGLSNSSSDSSSIVNASPANSEEGFGSVPATLHSSDLSPSASTSTLKSPEQNLSSAQRDSLHGITGLKKSPTLPPSILKTKPEKYCGASLYRPDEQSSNTSLYPDSRGRFGANALGLAPPSRRAVVGGGGYSSASAYLLPSPSVNGDRSQSQVDDSPLNSPSTNSASSISSSPAGSPPHENVPIGLGLGNQSSGMSWPNRRMKMIKLMEPDWTPYVQSHERARERLETAAHVAIIQSRGGSFSLPSSPISSPNTKRMGKIGIEDFRNSTIENWEEFPLLLRDSSRLHDLPSFMNNDTEAGDEDFWFERHVQSTAASGRDWDWRKRRARIAKAQNLALARANSLGHDASTQGPTNDLTFTNGANGTQTTARTDAQPQHQQRSSSRTPPVRTRSLPSSPLISFTPQELAKQNSELQKLPRMDSSTSSTSSSNSNSLSINTTSRSLEARGGGSSPAAFANVQTEGAFDDGRSQSFRSGSAPAGDERYRLPQLTTSDQYKLYSNDETSRWSNSVSGLAPSSSSSPNGKPKAQTSSSLRKKLMGSKSKPSATSDSLFSPTKSDTPLRTTEMISPSFTSLKRSQSNSHLNSAASDLTKEREEGSTTSKPAISPFDQTKQSHRASAPVSVPAYPPSTQSRRPSNPDGPPLEFQQVDPVPALTDRNQESKLTKPQRPRVRTMSLESTVRKKEEIDMLLREAEEYRSEEDGANAFEDHVDLPDGRPPRAPKASKRGILASMSEAASSISSPPRPKRTASYRDGAFGINSNLDSGSSPVSGWSSADAYSPVPSMPSSKASILNGSSLNPPARPQIKSRDTSNSISSSTSSRQSNQSNKVGSIHSSDSGSLSEKRWKADTSKGSGLPITLNHYELSASASEDTAFSIKASTDEIKGASLSAPRRASTTGSSNGSTSSSSLRRRSTNAQTSNGLLGGADISKTGSNTGSISSSTGTGDPPVMRYPRHSAKSSKRSTILNSADGASQILISQGSRGRGSSSIRPLRTSSLAPEPAVQPEPAPLGMVRRARSASINSNQSSPPSPRSQTFEKLTKIESASPSSSAAPLNGVDNRRSLPSFQDSTLAAALKAEHRLSSPPASGPPLDPLPPLPKV